ncbi:hypothetical protein RHECNPAF_280017 [Rhizobium etli CNPAF512]|nr:hypothetical protein RHECNPAF_280017 [Rhizobium etli CNPAF512]
MKARQRIVGHADLAVPFAFEFDIADHGEEPLQGALGPALVHGKPGIAQRPDTAENETTCLVHAEGGQDVLGIPGAFPSRQDRLTQIVAKRHGGEIEIGQIDLFVAHLLERAGAVGIGRDDDPVGADRAVFRLHGPAAAAALGCDDGARHMDGDTRLDGGMGKAARIGQRLQRSGAQVEQRTGIGVAADASGRLRRIEQRHGRAACGPLRRTRLDFLQPLCADRAVQCAVAFEFAGNAVPVDQLHDELRRIAEQLEQAFAVQRAEHAGQVVGHHPHAGIDQADIAPCAAETNLLRLQQHHLRAGFGKMQGRGEAGVAATDDDDVGRYRACERRGSRRFGCGLFPEAMGARIIQHGSIRSERDRGSLTDMMKG